VHAAYGEQVAKCPKCRTPELRERWGCDKPAAVAVYARTCEACFGLDSGCTTCDGRGEVRRDRCPSSDADDVGRVVIRALHQLQNGVLPIDGGWSEQSAKLMRLVDIAASERNKLQEAEARAAEARAKAAQSHGSKRR
jgi:hypothetical protein